MTATPIADMLSEMFAAGAPQDIILLAVRTAEASRDGRHDASRSVTVPNRSKEAERAARYRANRKQNQPLAKANDVANAGAEQRDGERDASRRSVTDHCDLSSSFLSKGTLEKASKQVVVARARGTRITEDFQPDDDAREFARSLKLDPKAVRDEFVDFWIAVPGPRGLKLHWQKTFKNRCREVAGRRKGFGNGQGQSVVAAADRLLEDVRALKRPIPGELELLQPGIRGGEGAIDVRLLPQGRRE